MAEKLSPEGQQLADMQEMRARMMSEWIKESQKGDRVKNIYEGGAYEILNKEIFIPLEQEAFNTIKNPDFDPSNINMVYQLRSLCQAVDQIRARIQEAIADGVSAKLKIAEYNSTLKEGE